jgi:arginyl-tRNA synthetase
MTEKIPNRRGNDCKTTSPAAAVNQAIAATIADLAVPLRRHKTHWPICYDSAIALKLAALQSQSPCVIAEQIVSGLPIDRSLWQVQVVPPSLIRFRCSEAEIAAWLQQSLQASRIFAASALSTAAESTRSRPPSEQIFRVQYMHGRCCTLLQSAVREGWLASPADAPLQIPWLTASGQLRLQHSVERKAIGLLFDCLDGIEARQLTAADLWKQAIELSQSLDTFQAVCRVWGEVKANDLPLAQARLGLTWAGQQLLQVLLTRLGIDAPIAL